MGFFDFLNKKDNSGTILAKHGPRVANKRAQHPDRWDAIQQVGRLKTSESVAALMPRFSFYVDPRTVDEEEKAAAYQWILDSGESAKEPVLTALQSAESLSWPLKILEKILPEEQIVEALIELLGKMSTEYERDPQRKLQALQALEEYKHERIVAAASRFLTDSNESARFHAARAVSLQTFAGDDRELVATIVADQKSREESLRVRSLFEEILKKS